MRQRRRQHRSRSRKQQSQRNARKQKKRRQRKRPHPTTITHPLFGEIPLIEVQLIPGEDTYTYWECDPDYKPDMPWGAVRGDIRRQNYWFDTPHYFYVDEERTCVQCRQSFVFSAQEQKFWYEGLQFHLSSRAIRCLRCRRRRRTRAALSRALEAAIAAAKADPKDAAALVQLAESTVAFATRTNEGDLDQAIAATRKARKLRPELIEAHYWEGRCQDLAGRRAKGRQCMREFLELAEPAERLRRMVKAAKRRVGRR